jgi:hypothetical protein
VACQWHKNFLARVEKSPGLFLPDDLQVVPAVGKFHLSAHRASCFFRFSLMFLKEAGHIDGEILETFWASFNKISPLARLMTLAHCQKLYDNHMRDLNWKKLVGIGKFNFNFNVGVKVKSYFWITVKTLLRKFKAASNGVETVEGPFKELSSAVNADILRLWTKEAEKADNERGEALDIYNVQMDKGWLSLFLKLLLLIILL